jgi:hypothetical protein
MDTDLFQVTFLFPETHVIAYSDNFLGEVPIYALLRVAGFEMQTAYQCWMIITWILNFLVCAWVVLKLTGDYTAAWIGAFVFAFALPVYDQSVHAQVISRYAIPLVFYFFVRFVRRGRPLFLLFALLSLVWQFYNSIYLGFLTSMALFFFLPALLIVFRNEIRFKTFFSFKAILTQIFILGISGLFLFKLMKPYVDQAEKVQRPDHALIVESLPHWNSYLLASPNSKTWNVLSTVPKGMQNFWNHYLFPGLLPVLCFVALLISVVSYLIKRRKESPDENMKLGLVWVLVLFGLFLITLRLPRHSFYELILFLPGFGAMRDLCRVINVELFFLGIITSWAIFYGLRMIKGAGAKYVVSFLLICFVIFENRYDFDTMPSYSKMESEKRISTLVNKILSKPNLGVCKAVVYMPSVNSVPAAAACQLDGMLACQRLGLKTVNGYTSTCPYMYCNFALNINLDGLKEWFGRKNLPVDSTQFVFVH